MLELGMANGYRASHEARTLCTALMKNMGQTLVICTDLGGQCRFQVQGAPSRGLAGSMHVG